MNYNYYWNDVPGKGKCRNNLVYTSLISDDKKVFCQWYYRDQNYHADQTQVVDQSLLEDKWQREVNMLTFVSEKDSSLVPEILDIDYKNKKIYLRVDGLDFWNRASTYPDNYKDVLPDWEEQVIDSVRRHCALGVYKFSMHPSSFFIVEGQLKSINYFFSYFDTEGPLSIADHASHIYSTRQEQMQTILTQLGITWDDYYSLPELQKLCFMSFQQEYTTPVTNRLLEIYK